MPKRKYIYHHLFNGKEVERGDFFRKLGMHYFETIVYDPYNPITNIDVVDEVKTRKVYERLKRSGELYIIWGSGHSESFQIKKERI